MSDYITPTQFREAGGTEDWRVIGDGMCTFVRTGSFAESAKLVHEIGAIDGIEEHPPAVDIRADGVTVRLVTYTADWFGPSTSDVEIARRISAVARDLGLLTDPSATQSVLVVPGAPDVASVMPFWQAVLGYEPRRDSPQEDLVDPRDRGPAFWFERMEQPRADGGGAIHVAVWVPPEKARERIDAALAAGGRMVRDDFAPAWWTLADSAGNEADIATIETRG